MWHASSHPRAVGHGVGWRCLEGPGRSRLCRGLPHRQWRKQQNKDGRAGKRWDMQGQQESKVSEGLFWSGWAIGPVCTALCLHPLLCLVSVQ